MYGGIAEIVAGSDGDTRRRRLMCLSMGRGTSGIDSDSCAHEGSGAGSFGTWLDVDSKATELAQQRR
jgi:hypothetical protein